MPILVSYRTGVRFYNKRPLYGRLAGTYPHVPFKQCLSEAPLQLKKRRRRIFKSRLHGLGYFISFSKKTMDTPLIEFRNVTKKFGDRIVLEKVNLAIYEGEITTIIGLSGAGKSVLLKHIIGLLEPDEGAVLFRGRPIKEIKRTDRSGFLQRISYMFQNNALFDSMTLFENVALPLQQTTNLAKKEIKRRAMARIEQTELTEVAHKYPTEISGGMQKRAALARALVTDPEIILFDEPTTGQDPIRKNAILGMIAQYKKKFNFTAVLISHEIPDVFFISDRILALHDKKIVFQGKPEELEDFEHPFKQEMVKSLESLQDELTGLYSRRHFKIRYQTSLGRSPDHETYAVIVFALDDPDFVGKRFGNGKIQEIMSSMYVYIDKHFGAVGGFFSQYTRNEVVTVLPYSDLEEAGRILLEFAKNIQKNGINGSFSTFLNENKNKASDFTISAGLAQGEPSAELDSILKRAASHKKEIAHFHCELRR